MIAPPPNVRVWLAAGMTDRRKGFDGLASLAQQQLGQDPFSGQLFVFRGRRGDLVKVLSWDGPGLQARRSAHACSGIAIRNDSRSCARSIRRRPNASMCIRSPTTIRPTSMPRFSLGSNAPSLQHALYPDLGLMDQLGRAVLGPDRRRPYPLRGLQERGRAGGRNSGIPREPQCRPQAVRLDRDGCRGLREGCLRLHGWASGRNQWPGLALLWSSVASQR